MNLALYSRSMSLLDLPHPRQRLTDTSADGYLLQIISDTEADYVINIDEDAFVTRNDRLTELVNYVIDNDFVNAGMPDGGIVKTRCFHPAATNPFFTIMNTKRIRELLDLEAIRAVDATDPRSLAPVPEEMLRERWDLVNYEPFYPLLLWLSQAGKTLYLDAREHADGITTELLDHLGRPFLLHTWWSRWYGRDIDHTDRICAIADEAARTSGRGHPTTRMQKFGLRVSMIQFRAARRLVRYLQRAYGV